MVEIRFKEGTQFNRLQLVKHLYERCDFSCSLKEVNNMVKSGVIKCQNREYDDVINMIVEHGGCVITNDGIRLLPNTIDSAQVTMLNKSKKKNVPAIRIVPSGYEEGLAIQSEIPVEKYVFQTLNDYHSLWQFVTNQMPFICGFTQQRIQLQNGEEEYRSLLGARISTNRNTVDEITSLSKVVRDVHAEMISTVLKFHNLTEKFKPFIDDAPVETRSDSNDPR